MGWSSEAILQIIRDNERWAAPFVLAMSFLESFAFISLLVPATVILVGVSALIGATSIAFLPIYAAAVAGAFLGDWVAFELALWLGPRVASIWPISRDPTLLDRGLAWFTRWGVAAVFVGRFFGPMRAAVPLVAGVARMPRISFQLANIASALVWGAGILIPGAFGLPWLLK
jgi:membrane protein DedA with SNARE-associated domain